MNKLFTFSFLICSISVLIGYILLLSSEDWGVAYCMTIPFLYIIIGILTRSYYKTWGNAFLISSGIIAFIGFAVCSGSITLGPH